MSDRIYTCGVHTWSGDESSCPVCRYPPFKPQPPQQDVEKLRDIKTEYARHPELEKIYGERTIDWLISQLERAWGLEK